MLVLYSKTRGRIILGFTINDKSEFGVRPQINRVALYFPSNKDFESIRETAYPGI